MVRSFPQPMCLLLSWAHRAEASAFPLFYLDKKMCESTLGSKAISGRSQSRLMDEVLSLFSQTNMFYRHSCRKGWQTWTLTPEPQRSMVQTDPRCHQCLAHELSTLRSDWTWYETANLQENFWQIQDSFIHHWASVPAQRMDVFPWIAVLQMLS